MMKLPTLFKQRPNKRYNYTPRYYNERKERLEALQNQTEKKTDEDYSKGNRRTDYQSAWRRHRSSAGSKKNASTLRLCIIIIMLLALAYYLLKG